MGSRFKDRGLGAINADERRGAEAGAQAGLAVSTLVTSAKAQGVDPPAPTASFHQKQRAAERQARVCGPSTAAPCPRDYCQLSCQQLNSNLLFARVG